MKKLKIGENIISYKEHKFEGSKHTILFLHGLMSDMNGSKSTAIEEYAVKSKINYVAFDNLGHGSSSGEFIENNISTWLSATIDLIKELKLKNIILIGSSMGGWLAILISLIDIENIISLILIAPAPDFTEDIKSKLTESEIGLLENGSIINSNYAFPISKKLLDAEGNLILPKERIKINIPIIIIHGMEDSEVDSRISEILTKKIISPYICTKYVKHGNHRLSTNHDIRLIIHSIDELMNYTKSDN
jgi:pimeloyl-ACP methyl ester carboxylesterase